jgi:hypothetical protein
MKNQLMLIITFLDCDRKKMTDGRSWLPLHIAIALGNKVRKEDVYSLYLHDPLVMRRYSSKKSKGNRWVGYLPGHLLCMQTHPNMSLVRSLSARDMKALSLTKVVEMLSSLL